MQQQKAYVVTKDTEASAKHREKCLSLRRVYI